MHEKRSSLKQKRVVEGDKEEVDKRFFVFYGTVKRHASQRGKDLQIIETPVL